ncbi:HEPN domain-containing protein [Thermaerobacter litoralis]
MRSLDRSQDWWDEALGDLAHAESDDLERGFYNWACFSAHQAADKAVKAVCQRFGGEAWGHSVYALLEALAEQVPVPDDLRDRALELDKAHIPTRYPDAHPVGAPRRLYTASEARRMLDHARVILEFCARYLSVSEP